MNLKPPYNKRIQLDLDLNISQDNSSAALSTFPDANGIIHWLGHSTFDDFTNTIDFSNLSDEDAAAIKSYFSILEAKTMAARKTLTFFDLYNIQGSIETAEEYEYKVALMPENSSLIVKYNLSVDGSTYNAGSVVVKDTKGNIFTIDRATLNDSELCYIPSSMSVENNIYKIKYTRTNEGANTVELAATIKDKSTSYNYFKELKYNDTLDFDAIYYTESGEYKLLHPVIQTFISLKSDSSVKYEEVSADYEFKLELDSSGVYKYKLTNTSSSSIVFLVR